MGKTEGRWAPSQETRGCVWGSGESHKPDTGRCRPEARQHCIAAQASRAPPSMNSSPSPLTRAHKECIRKCLVQIRETPSQGDNLSRNLNSGLCTSLPPPALPLVWQGAVSRQPVTLLLVSAFGLKRLSSQLGSGCDVAPTGAANTTHLRHTCALSSGCTCGSQVPPPDPGSPASQPASPQLHFKPSPCSSPHFPSPCGSLKNRVG